MFCCHLLTPFRLIIHPFPSVTHCGSTNMLQLLYILSRCSVKLFYPPICQPTRCSCILFGIYCLQLPVGCHSLLLFFFVFGIVFLRLPSTSILISVAYTKRCPFRASNLFCHTNNASAFRWLGRLSCWKYCLAKRIKFCGHSKRHIVLTC